MTAKEPTEDNPSGKANDTADHRNRMRFEWNDLMEDLIKDGQERGVFDDLPGKGKPLDLKRSTFGADWDLAHSLMKENDVAPVWAQKRNRILAEVEAFRIDMIRRWTKHKQAYRYAQGAAQSSGLVLSWRTHCRQWEQEVTRINKQIDDFNLTRPHERMEIFKLRLDDELERVGAARELA